MRSWLRVHHRAPRPSHRLTCPEVRRNFHNSGRSPSCWARWCRQLQPHTRCWKLGWMVVARKGWGCEWADGGFEEVRQRGRTCRSSLNQLTFTCCERILSSSKSWFPASRCPEEFSIDVKSLCSGTMKALIGYLRVSRQTPLFIECI